MVVKNPRNVIVKYNLNNIGSPMIISDQNQYLRVKKQKNTPMFSLHDKYVVVPADKASNNTVCLCKIFLCMSNKCTWHF